VRQISKHYIVNKLDNRLYAQIRSQTSYDIRDKIWKQMRNPLIEKIYGEIKYDLKERLIRDIKQRKDET